MSWFKKIFGKGGGSGDVMEERQTEQPGRYREVSAEHRADRQTPDTTGLVREGEPRGGMSAEAYNSAAPTDIVAEDDVVMSGPGGAVQEETTPEERRADQRD